MQPQTETATKPADPVNQGDPETATGHMAVMGKTGDTKFYWSVNKWAEVEAAKAVFDMYKGKGFAAFSMNAKGDQGEQLKEFDPSAGSIIFIPALVGG